MNANNINTKSGHNKRHNTHSKKLMLRENRQPGLVAFYDIWPGNGAGLFFQPRTLTGLVNREV